MELKECFTQDCFTQIKNLKNECEKVLKKLKPMIEENYLSGLSECIETLQLVDKNNLLEKDMNKIMDYSPYLNFSDFSIIKECVFDGIKKEKEKLDHFFEKYREQEEDAFNQKMEGFNKMQSFHKFMSIWSIYEISPKDMNKVFSDDIVESVSYKGNSIDVNKKISWLEMWALGEQLIKMSQDTHHIFIEYFESIKENPRKYKMNTGS